MYNKLFGKILDSSIWLESHATRLVWLTLIAAMDQDGFACFASPANLAHRAVVSLEECEAALRCLEGPDPNSSDPDNEGRRVERVDGGWVILNAAKYGEIVTRAVAREKTRERVRRYRERKAGNAPVTVDNDSVTPSDADVDVDAENKTARSPAARYSATFERFWQAYPKRGRKAKAKAAKLWAKLSPDDHDAIYRDIVQRERAERDIDGWAKGYVHNACTYLGPGRHWEDDWAEAPTVRAPATPHATTTCCGRAWKVGAEYFAHLDAAHEGREPE